MVGEPTGAGPDRAPSGAALAEYLVDVVVDIAEEFEERHAPGFVIPRTFGGHLVGPDAVADVAYTLGWLHELGVDEIAGRSTADALRTVLRQVDGAGTHSFFSYRIAETLGRFGSFEGNPLLDGLTTHEVEEVRGACDSTELVPLLDGLLPRNYAAVIARCEHARAAIGLSTDPALLDELVDRTRALVSEHPEGYLDESPEGAGRFDIYTADIYLFCEPLAGRLGEVWERGARTALDLVAAVGSDDGTAVTWGRSTGELARALTLELAALAVRRELTDEPDRWLGLAFAASEFLSHEFDAGVTAAYQGRSPEAYRGPQRRLQLTFDLLGKYAYAARGLRAADGPPDVSLRPQDDLRRFSERAAVWAYRNDRIRFVLPFVSGRSSDYLPAPREPGLFETPVDSVLACFVPVVHRAGGPLEPEQRFAPGETPTAITHEPGRLTVTHDRFVATRPIDGPHRSPDSIGAARTATYRVDGARVEVAERLRFEEVPAALSLLVPVFDRPLRIEARPADAARVRTVPVGGMQEWQSAWGAATHVHEIEIEPATDVGFTWSVGPASRVLLTSADHHYVRTVYDSVTHAGGGGRIVDLPWTRPWTEADVLHVHWPEWSFGFESTVDDHRAITDELRADDVRIAWTQHNLTPHLDDPDTYDPIYQVWADATDLAIHHSEWGRAEVTARYRFGDDCRHVVIPHPHFGPQLTATAALPRDEAAARIGLDTAPAIRVGMIGAPRKEKDVRLVVDALVASGRTDIELVIWSLSFTDAVPDPVPGGPQIVAEVYGNVDRATYDLRLAACDAIALPFTGHTMLATGTASDLVATATPGLVTDWPYLTEHLGELGLRFGQTVESWTEGFRTLDVEGLRAAAAHAGELRDRYDPTRIAEATADAIEGLGVRPLRPTEPGRFLV